MARTAIVNYHVHKPERQAFELDADGIAGNLISPELAPTEVKLFDQREGAADISFAEDCIGFAHAPTVVGSFDATENWRDTYEAELRTLLATHIGAKEVVSFDHTVRIDDPEAVRKPARNVHSDYSVDGAQQRLIDILGAAKAMEWAASHYAFINVWRPVGAPINSAPLGFIQPSSVADEDWILLDLIYPDRKGQIMGLAANPDHKWVYMSKMTPDEIAFFNIFDSGGRPSVGHSALDTVEDPTVKTIRQSIESRTLVRY